VVVGGAALAQKASVPKASDKLALASENAKEMLLLMDTDKNGKISKQEWMTFMSAEFDRLDVNKSGELDPKELANSSVSLQPGRFSSIGK
jgi:Ca2+-binding EF-hand superfamily protein